jgi:amino acid transporter
MDRKAAVGAGATIGMKIDKSKTDRKSPPTGTLGTFAGVFTPSILTILGIILFLRLGYVVGSAGLGRALLILVLANGISLLTSFSLSAIATNLRVKGGGDYYLISRTLGLQFGGSIGIVLYLAQSVSIAFYCIGFGEVVAELTGSQWPYMAQVIAAAAVAFLFIFAWLGADWATRFQYVVMVILGAALASFFIGGIGRWDGSLLATSWSAPSGGPGFWVIFAIFFPAVTGFTQGVSMSGDLKDPGRSLPTGTFAAVGLSIVVYFLSAILLAAALPQATLTQDYGAMGRVALFRGLVTAGVVAATLSSAMASYLGAPRILQSLATDRIFPALNPFAKGYGPANNPRRGVLLSTVIAFGTIGIGQLNLIAPLVSMFFLISYGLLNYATFYESRSESPSFRPRFRWFDYRASLVGALACLGAMLAIDPVPGAAALVILYAIYLYLKQKAKSPRWADSRRSYHMQRIRVHLLEAAAEPEHPRYWRPQLLVFADKSLQRQFLLRFAAWIQGRSGFTAAVRILTGQTVRLRKEKQTAEDELKADIRETGLEAFPLVVLAGDRKDAVQVLVQSFGIGPLHANTVLLNWVNDISDSPEHIMGAVYGRSLREAYRFGCNLIIIDATDEEWKALKEIPAGKRRIDVWWQDDATGNLMLLLAYLITRSVEWEGATIRMLAAGYGGKADDLTQEALQQRLDDVRINAVPAVVDTLDSHTVIETSRDASLVFLPMRIQDLHTIRAIDSSPEDLFEHLPLTALVLAAETIELDAEPEQGEAAERANALDALSDAEKRAEKARKEAEKAATAAQTLTEKLSHVQSSVALQEKESALVELMADTRKAEDELEVKKRRLAKEKAKAETAAREAEAIGAKEPEVPSDQEEN